MLCTEAAGILVASTDCSFYCFPTIGHPSGTFGTAWTKLKLVTDDLPKNINRPFDHDLPFDPTRIFHFRR